MKIPVALATLMIGLPLAAQSRVSPADQLLDRIVEREATLIAIFQMHTPVVETYIQETPAAGGDAAPTKDHYFLGQIKMSSSMEYVPLIERTDPAAKGNNWLTLHANPRNQPMKFLAGEAIKAGSQNSLEFNVWEGEIASPVIDNRWVGCLKITGSELEQGVIAKGAELVCEYEVTDSGNVMLEVTVPSVGGLFKTGHNLYSRQESSIDYSAASQQVHEEAERQLNRLDEIAAKVDDPKIDRAREKLDQALAASSDEGNPEQSKEAMDRVQDAKKIIARIRDANLKTIRQMELDSVIEFFDTYVRGHAKPSEETQFDNAVRSSKRAIDNNDSSFENYLSDLRGKNWDILWRQDSFVIHRFQWLSKSPHLFTDRAQFKQLSAMGQKAAEDDDMHKLRDVVLSMDSIRIHIGGDDGMSEGANIIAA